MNQSSLSIPKGFRNLSLIICFLCLISLAVYLVQGFMGGLSIGLSSETGPQISTRLDTELRTWRERVAFIPFHLSVIFALLYGAATFWELSKGNIFTERSVKHLRLLSFWMLTIALSAMFSGIFLYLLRAVSGYGLDNNLSIELSASEFVTLGLSGMVHAFAWILREAKRHLDDVRLIF